MEILLQGEIVDVCVDGRRCLIRRFPDLRGDRLFLFCENGRVEFDAIAVCPLQ